jgi:hypothetical protein
MMRVGTAIAAVAAALACCAQLAALKTAAGGGPSGQNGFASAVNFFDRLLGYGVYVVVALGGLGLLIGFGRWAIGDEDGTKWMTLAALGIGGSLLVRGFVA